MTQTINGVMYAPGAEKSTYKNKVQYYPIVKFWSSVASDSFYINAPKPTRAKALTVAKRHINNMR